MPHSHIDTWIFDLDNTLYKAGTDFFGQIDIKMTDFVSNYLELPFDEARKIQKQYLAEYGTTLSGLMAHHGMKPDAFLDFVHDIDLALLSPDPKLRDAIEALPGRKFIFTNGTQKHAANVAGHLQLDDLFDGSFGIEDANYVPKPQASPYDLFIDRFAIDPSSSFMAEDMHRNLAIPKSMGMKTLLVTSQADFSNEPEAYRPLDGSNVPHYVDDHTDDLAGWLANLPL